MNLTTTNKTELFSPEINFEYFTDFAKHFIKKMESGQVLTKKKVKFSADTIRQYNVSIAHFEKLEESLQARVKIYQINKKLLEAFEKYLYDTGLLFNSVYLYISKIKAIGNILFDEEQINRPVKFSTPKKLTTQIYLTQQELKKMKECQELTDSERQVLDVFLVQCFTGMRHSSVVEFLSNPLAYIKQLGEATYIDIISQKTGEQSIIPLSKVVFELLNKYNFKFELKSEEFMNRAIKKIAEKSGIDNPIAVQITKESITETKIVPKYKKISTHTCRRSYLTLIKQYISDDEAIMAISGHTSSQAMRNYVRSSKLDRILPYMNNDFFKIEI